LEVLALKILVNSMVLAMKRQLLSILLVILAGYAQTVKNLVLPD